MVAIAGGQRSRARNIAACFAHRVDAAHHHIVDEARIKLVARLDGGQRRHRQAERRDFVQRTILFAATARRAHGVVDKGFGH